jgi:UDP-glucose 4-epimerase
VRHAHSSHDKTRRVFGPRPEVGLDDGLGRMAAWVRTRGARASAPFGGIEIVSGLPKSWHS